MKVAAIFKPRGGMSQTAVLMLLGIHSTKYELHVSMKEMGAINWIVTQLNDVKSTFP